MLSIAARLSHSCGRIVLSPSRIRSIMVKGGSIVRATDTIGVKQLFDDDSSTYTYLLYDADTKDAILVDPVDLQVERGS